MAYYSGYNSNINSMDHSEKFSYLKKALRILLSVSILSFLVLKSQSNSLGHFSYDCFLSEFSVKLTERNYVFLLCNGILALIIRTSGLISRITPVLDSSSSSRDDGHHDAEQVDDDHGPGFDQENEPKDVGDAQDGGGEGVEDSGIEDSGIALLDAEEVEGSWEEEEGEEGEIDELHKKCEDFVKKMKQQIQLSDDQRQSTF